jgi:Uma2 family endonuclease
LWGRVGVGSEFAWARGFDRADLQNEPKAGCLIVGVDMATTAKLARTVYEPVPDAPDVGGFRPYRMTVDLYEKLVESYAFGDTSPVFLWQGRLVLPEATGFGHRYSLVTLNQTFHQVVPDGWHVQQRSPIRVSDDSEPEPDLTVLVGPVRAYLTRTPAAADAALVVEITETSGHPASVQKLTAYAAASIPVYWVVNIPARRIDVYTGPSGPTERPTYSKCQPYRPGDDVPVVLDGREVGRIAVGDVLA